MSAKWVQDKAVEIIGIGVVILLAVLGFVYGHSETLVRHDEQIKALREDSAETQALLNTLRNDIGCIKENIVKISTYVEGNNPKRN